MPCVFRNIVAILLAVTVTLMFVCGCQETAWQGEIARINGRPITLAHVTALRDSTYFDWLPAPATEFDEMRKQYGDALTELLIAELVKTYLEEKKIAISEADVDAEEALIRSDYPEGAFDTVLLNEGVDRDTWRFLLKNYLSVQRLLDIVLRPDILITPEEARIYVRTHADTLTMPAWTSFILLSGRDAALVQKSGLELRAHGNPVQVQMDHPEIIVRTVRMPLDRLEPIFAAELGKLVVGNLSVIVSINEEFHQMLLLERSPEREISPSEVYQKIEEELIGQKLHVAYNNWIQKYLARARIIVSRKLLPHS